MKRNDEALLVDALKAMQAEIPEAVEVSASARRVAERLGLDASGNLSASARVDAIEGCADVRQSLDAYRAGSLSTPRSLLVAAHLRDCGECLRHSRSVAGPVLVDWSAPKAAPSVRWQPRAFGWASIPACALLVLGLIGYKAYWQVPPGVRAEVQSIDGSAYSIGSGSDHRLAPGDQLTEGEHLRTSGGAHAVLRLADGSTVEVNERSVLAVGARGHDMTLSLDDGAVIVQATKRDAGHLYVKTPDCRVAVTGTVFSVSSGIKGSRVAVLQGTVHVMHAGVDTLVPAGDQIATNTNLTPAPVAQQIAWSHDQAKYLPLLAQFALLEHRFGNIPFPQPRYSSDLVARVPADTLLYVSIPNLGDFLSQANSIFQDQLKQSPELQQWWSNGKGHNPEEFSALVEKLHDMSGYLGDEVVVVGMKQDSGSGFAVIADLQKAGLDDYLRTQFAATGSSHGIVVLDPDSLNAMGVLSKAQPGPFALIRRHEVVFSGSIATLKQISAQLDAGPSGFAAGDFGKQIMAAYGRGAGVILAADLHQMIGSQSGGAASGKAGGMENVRYLIAEHRETNGEPENHLNLQFAGARQQIASWLAAPAPIGSLDFITPNAAVVVAGLSKDPAAIADDMMAMAGTDREKAEENLNEVQQKLNINFRDDIAANLGGDFLLSLDGPVLPTPAWKAVIEVHNADRLEQTLERLTLATQGMDAQDNDKARKGVTIQMSEADGQRYYSIVATSTGATVAQYTFADGYMIVAPSRALLMEALQTHRSGNSLAHSTAFRALLPKDENENYSAVAYQNLSPVLTPLLSQFKGQSATALQQLAADARPTAICAWGKDSRIEAASNSHLLGFDFLTLAALFDHGNHPPAASVKE